MRAANRVTTAAVAVLTLMGVGLFTPAAAYEGETACSGTHQGDKMAALAWTDKSDNTVGGVGAGIDDFTGCDVFADFDADNMVDTYLSGRVYEYFSGSYSTCIDRITGWRGYWSSTNQSWLADLDYEHSTHCGWYSKPIKVRSIAKGLFGDGTIVTATAFHTTTQT